MRLSTRNIERWYLALVAGLAFAATVSLFLAQKGWFHAWIAIAAGAAFLIPSFLALRGAPAGRDDGPGSGRGVLAALAGIVLIAGALFLRPHEYMVGGWDPGVYVNTAVSVSRTGSLNTRDEVLTRLPPAERRLFHHVRGGVAQKYSGFSVAGPDEGIVQPRFYHLYPSLSTIPAAFAGARGVLYVNPVLAIAAVIGLFLLGRALLSPVAGLAAAALMALDPVQVWFSRFPTSEITAQLFLLTGALALVRYLDAGHRGHALASAVCLGAALLTKSSMVLVLVPALAIAFLCRRERLLQRKDAAFFLVLGVFFLYLAWQAWCFNRVYVEYLFSRVYPSLRRRLPFLVPPVALAALAMRCWYARLRGTSARFERTVAVSRWALVAALVALALYGYLIRPRLGHGFNLTNLVELGWFVSPPGLVAAMAGVACAVLKPGRGRAFPLALFLASAVLFLYSKVLYPIYPWALRRYVTMVIPGLALYGGIATVYAHGWMARRAGASRPSPRRRRAAGAVTLAAVTALAALKIAGAPLLVTSTDHRGLTRAIDDIARHCPDGLIICEESWLATPLAFMYGKETVQVSDLDPRKCEKLEPAILKLRAAAGETWYVPLQEKPFGELLDFTPGGSRSISTSVLHRPFRSVPRAMRPFEQEVTFYRVEEAGARRLARGETHRIDIGDAQFGLRGFYRPHRRGDLSIGRWTFGTGEVFLPWPESGTVTLRVSMGGQRPEGMPPTPVRLVLGGELVVERDIPHEFLTYAWELEAADFRPSGSGRIALRFESSTWDPSEHGIRGYPRGLGVMVSRVEVSH